MSYKHSVLSKIITSRGVLIYNYILYDWQRSHQYHRVGNCASTTTSPSSFASEPLRFSSQVQRWICGTLSRQDVTHLFLIFGCEIFMVDLSFSAHLCFSPPAEKEKEVRPLVPEQTYKYKKNNINSPARACSLPTENFTWDAVLCFIIF